MELIITVLCFTIPFVIFKRWYWFWMMVGVIVLVAVAEGLTFLFTGQTLSQLFWQWGAINPTGKWITLGSLTLGWIALMYHLGKRK